MDSIGIESPLERKEKVTPVARYRRECEPVSMMLITVVRDARKPSTMISPHAKEKCHVL